MNDLDVIYQYDGTFAGFLCCIYDSYVYKESPVGFSSDEGFLSLYEVRTVPTSAAHSKRVYQGIFSRSAQAAKAAASWGICPIRCTIRCTSLSGT